MKTTEELELEQLIAEGYFPEAPTWSEEDRSKVLAWLRREEWLREEDELYAARIASYYVQFLDIIHPTPAAKTKEVNYDN